LADEGLDGKLRGVRVRALRVIGAILAIGAAASFVLVITVVSLVYRDPAQSCYYSTAPAGSATSEGIFPDGELSWFPLGLRCIFPASSGGSIVVSPGYAVTWIAAGLAALAIVGLVLLIVSGRCRTKATAP